MARALTIFIIVFGWYLIIIQMVSQGQISVYLQQCRNKILFCRRKIILRL